MAYQTKAHIVEAFRYGMEPEPQWFKEAVSCGDILIGYSIMICVYGEIEHQRLFVPGDYVVKLPNGRIYPYTVEEFESLYVSTNEKVEGNES